MELCGKMGQLGFSPLHQHLMGGFLFIIFCCWEVAGTAVDKDVSGSEIWHLKDSPYVIRNSDLFIPADAHLRIEPGVQVHLGPGLGIKVKGRLTAAGLPGRKITFTRIPLTTNGPREERHVDIHMPRRIRLVGGREVRQGMLQLWVSNHWRSVCSRNTEWTKTDCRVTCQQLGFADGNFTLGPMAQNRIPSVELVAPACQGNESAVDAKTGLFSCPGTTANLTIGSTVCQHQDLVGLNCWGANPARFSNHWRGIEFFNATVSEISLLENFGGSLGNTRLNTSASVLENVDILYAGVSRSFRNVAALSASPYPPPLNHVRIAHSAYDALNFSQIRGPALLKAVTFEENLGHGASIESLLGYVRMVGVISRNNGGGGARVQLVSGPYYHWPEEAPELVHRAYWLCRPGAIPASPVFPFLVVAELPGPTFRESGACELRIASDQINQILTITTLEVLLDPIASGLVEIWDESTGQQLARWPLMNTSAVASSQAASQRQLGVRTGRLFQGISSIRNAILLRFSWRKPRDQAICSQFAGCARVILQVAVGRTTVPEVSIKNSEFSGNLQHGVNIETPWSYVEVLGSIFSQNHFGSGLQITNGSANVFIHNCSFLQNERTGLNISTSGGFRQINQSRFDSNRGHGISVWNPRGPDSRESHDVIETHVHTSLLTKNWWNGIQFYNSCEPMNVLVNFSTFIQNGNSGIRMYSCIKPDVELPTKFKTNFTVGFSEFIANARAAILVEPMTQMTGHVTNSTFTEHRHNTIVVDNSLDMLRAQLYRSQPVDYVIKNCYFTKNDGRSVVNLRLTEISELQRLSVMYNKFIGNRIHGIGKGLNPRSTAPAVIVVGSSSVQIIRNHLWNPDSELEIASHLSAADKRINATMNFWGALDDWNVTEWGAIHKVVLGKLFDQNHRYTLAQIDYYPVLKDPDLRSKFSTENEPPYVPPFTSLNPTTGVTELGGRIAVERSRQIELMALPHSDQYYHVVRDIFIPPGGILIVRPGVRLHFDNGVGIFSQGEIRLAGSREDPIIMCAVNHMVNISREFTNYTSTAEVNKTMNSLNSMTNRTFRLTGGSWVGDAYHGRLEIAYPLRASDGPLHDLTRPEHHDDDLVWGTVCGPGFEAHAAMLSCSALGLVAHPKDWLVTGYERERTLRNANHWFNSSSTPIHLANVDCEGHESALPECKFDGLGKHNCQHDEDIVIRCHQPGWAGIRVTASDPGSRTAIRHLRLSNAGLLDYARMQFMPTLQLDYHSGTIEELEISRGLSTGLTVSYSDALLGTRISKCRLTDNFDHGLLTQTPWMVIEECQIRGSRIGSGISYNPSLSPEEINELHAGFVPTLTLFTQQQTTTSFHSPEPTTQLEDSWLLVDSYQRLHPTGTTFINIAPGRELEKTIYRTELESGDANHLHQIVFHLMDYNTITSPRSDDQAFVSPNATVGPANVPTAVLPATPVACYTMHCIQYPKTNLEELIIYDSSLDKLDLTRAYRWHIPRDLPRLPLVSSSYRITIELRVQGIRSARWLFAVQTQDFQHFQHPRNAPNSGSSNHFVLFGLEPDSRYSPIPNLQVLDSTIEDNSAGITFYHYNDPTDSSGSLYWRHAGEVFTMHANNMSENRGPGIFVNSISRLTNDWHLPTYSEYSTSTERLSFIGYNVSRCLITRNTGGILMAEHSHVEFANNVWSYRVEGCNFEKNGFLSQNGTLGRENEHARPRNSEEYPVIVSHVRSRGMTFQLPFVSPEFDWRYQPRRSHKLTLVNNRFKANHRFSLFVGGFYAEIEVEDNTFEDNQCLILDSGSNILNGLVSLEGMEKETKMASNRFIRNYGCEFVVRFQGQSQAPLSTAAVAYIYDNIFRDNSCELKLDEHKQNNRGPKSFDNSPFHCFTMGIFGTQNATLRQNWFDNFRAKDYSSTSSGMRYELIAGVSSILIPNFLDARRNFWSTTEPEEIRRRIFGFDDWNSLTIIRFEDFLLDHQPPFSPTFRGIIPKSNNIYSKEAGLLGGRLTENTRLEFREEPYRVVADLTVMPGCELTIDSGVQLEFVPHTGLLVLGRLVARGLKHDPIRFRPIQVPKSSTAPGEIHTKTKPASKSGPSTVVGSGIKKNKRTGLIGLSSPDIRLIGGERTDEGFVQFYNSTVRRWDIVCDHLFSSQVAQVVCRELGRPTLNAIVRTSDLYDDQVYGYENSLVMKHIWMESYTCHGFEVSRFHCSSRLNYDYLRCLEKKEFAFLRCAPLPFQKNIDPINSVSVPSWGNIRIIRPITDERPTNSLLTDDRQSILEYVELENAGLLHGEQVSAITTIYTYPRLAFINITNCLGNGFEFIAPRGPIDVTNTTVTGCIGHALGLTVLNGDSTDPISFGLDNSQISSPPALPPNHGSLFPPPRPSSGQSSGVVAADLMRLPLKEYPLSGEQNVLGFISMCSGEKTITLLDRLLIQYRYSWTGIQACSKIFRSAIPGRQLAWRFLAVNLYHDPFAKNSVELFNGANFNTTYLIAKVTSETIKQTDKPANQRFTFVTSAIHDVLSVLVYTSPASDRFGFISEVVSLPLSPTLTHPEMYKLVQHRVDTCEFERNQGGGLCIVSVGESGPDLHLANLRFIENGVGLLNLTGPPAVYLHLTNSYHVALTNSYFTKHFGDVIRIYLHASQMNLGTRVNVTNNEILRNQLGGALLVEGNHFNRLQVLRNYISHNDCGQRDLIRISGVIAQPFSHNFIHDNRANVILHCSGEENLSRGSLFISNGFYKNEAINYTRRATIFMDSSKHTFRNNYFRNPRNDYEMVTGNRSVLRFLPIQPGTSCPTNNDDCATGWQLRLEFDACLCYRPDPIDARSNWWGNTKSPVQPDLQSSSSSLDHSESVNAVESRPQSFARTRIYDEEDDPYLISVDFRDAYADNSSVLGQGTQCPPTWAFVDQNCFFYFGGPMNYEEAHDFCINEAGGILATSRDRVQWLSDLVSKWQHNYEWINRYVWVSRAWVNSQVPLLDYCPATSNGWLEPYPCKKRIGFFCQKGK